MPFNVVALPSNIASFVVSDRQIANSQSGAHLSLLHRRIVVARRSIGSLLQLLALGGFASQKITLSYF